MGNRRFEMHDLRKVLVRMRQGETDRQIARGGFVGRAKASEIRKIAADQGWLDVAVKLPKNDELAKLFRPSRVREQAVSTVTQFHEQIEKWRTDGIQGTTIHNALDRKYGYSGSYSSVRRYLQRLNKLNPEVTIMLDFHPGEAAQVDFGKGGEFVDVKTGEIVSGWFFVMTLAWSRYQYAELVRDQKIETWLGCHRRAFEFFGGVPGRVLIDNPKCAITRACYHDPVVQRSYEDFAEEYGLKIDPCPVRDPKKKGRVESGVKYVKNNFMPLRDFRRLMRINN